MGIIVDVRWVVPPQPRVELFAAIRADPRSGMPGSARVLSKLIGKRCRNSPTQPHVLSLGIVVVLLEVGGMYLYYLTPLFGYTERHMWAHVVVHLHMFAAGCLFSWYVVGRDPMPTRPSILRRGLVLFVAAGAHDVLAKLMYAHTLPADAGTIAQLRDGAQLMFYGGDMIDLLLAAALMTQWYARGGRELDRSHRRAITLSAH
ncbi:cytochrome c oxidase assembly protein [Flexivirga caeni]|uniref:Cytochrome c oxidase assembly protein n=1 Tax=Flexivirga caeni TaxID=2294115 RepID=A0A3M9MGS2_9MICO|nr:cytochrome c oxidase assembly protein [Flexivirga caeni]RNI24752.1 cytochrome c oxidase assembly protein [Flexivirga caeni]